MSANVKSVLMTVQPFSIGLIALGAVGLYATGGVTGIFTAPLNYVQLASAGAVTLGSVSYLFEQGYILTN